MTIITFFFNIVFSEQKIFYEILLLFIIQFNINYNKLLTKQ